MPVLPHRRGPGRDKPVMLPASYFLPAGERLVPPCRGEGSPCFSDHLRDKLCGRYDCRNWQLRAGCQDWLRSAPHDACAVYFIGGCPRGKRCNVCIYNSVSALCCPPRWGRDLFRHGACVGRAVPPSPEGKAMPRVGALKATFSTSQRVTF